MAARRQVNSSDETAYPVGSETRRCAEVARQYLEAAELALMPNADIIQRSLSVKSVVFTSSSFAQRSQQAVGRSDLQHIVQIGAGFQGVVFEQVGQAMAMKKEIPGNSGLRTNLLHEYSLHRAVMAAFDKYDGDIKSGVRVPRLIDIIQETDDNFWEQNLHKFPDQYRTRGTMVRMERILPLPKVTRKALIVHFYPPPLNWATLDAVINATYNKHCLARIYLGKENMSFTRETFSLRNFPLCLRPMQDHGLDVVGLATSMGKAFAIMHWGAGVNGDDVEFVLGTSAVKGNQDHGKALFDFQHRAVGFYLLDFGQCDLVDLSDEVDVVYQAFKGAMVTGDNQLFIPHLDKNPELFVAFKEGYMRAGQAILEEKQLDKKFNMQDFMREYEEYAEDFL